MSDVPVDDRRRPSRGAGSSVALCALGLAATAIGAQRSLRLHELYVPMVLGAFLLGAAAVLVSATRQLPEGAFGAANQVTLARGALTALVLGLLFVEPSIPLLWYAIGVAALALLLDGIDGPLARHRGTASAFGARFDMETDALLILVLAMLAWHSGKAGAWVLLSGLLRYVFVAAGRLLPWMRRPLPASRRRQAVCVVQVLSLLVCLLPFVPPRLGAAVAAIGLSALLASFGADTVWLARRSAADRLPALG